MKTHQAIIVFYLSYMVWLFLVIFLSPDVALLTIFTGLILLFYLVFLSDFWDIAWMFAGIIIFLIVTVVQFNSFQIKIDRQLLASVPLWVYLAWGTTVVALKKFFTIASK